MQSCKENPANQLKYMRRISLIHQNSADCEAVLKMGLSTQKTLVELISNETCTQCFFNGEPNIDLSQQANVFQLLPPEAMPESVDLSEEDCVQYIKQGSDLWHQQRKKARITGSTLYRALGLKSLSSQKEHHVEFILGRKPLPFSPEVQQRLEHGLKHEKNVIATLVAYIMLSFLPPCFRYLEVGPMFIHIPAGRGFIEVSPDGVFKCVHGPNCEYKDLPNHKRIGVEVKSPYPDPNNPQNIYYDIRPRNVPQVEAEMIVLEADELWLLCGGQQSIVAMRQMLHEDLWAKLLSVGIDLYGEDKPNVPTHLHPTTRDLWHMLSAFSQTNSIFMCEVPLLFGEYGSLKIDQEVESPNAVTTNVEETEIDYELVNNLVRLAATEATTFFHQAHNVLRNQAHEVLVFMITEKDRLQQDCIPYAYPVAYALKGSSMGNADLRFMVSEVRAECNRRKIPLLCEVYDGQWQQFIASSTNGDHLTKLHGRNTWNHISAYSKEKVLSEMNEASVVKTFDLDLLRISKKLCVGGQVEFGNITVWRSNTGALFTETLGGPNFDEPVMSKFVSVTEITRPDLFPLDTNQTQSAVLGQFAEEHRYTVRRKESNVIADVSGEASVENEMAETLNRELHAGDVTLQKQGGIRTRKAKGLQPGE